MNTVGPARGEQAAPRPAPRLLATLRFAAEKEYLGLARMTAAHVAGLCDLRFSRVTDLRLAVDEACALFLGPVAAVTDTPSGAPSDAPSDVRAGGAPARGGLSLTFEVAAGTLRITVSGPAPRRRPDLDGLGWTLLCALVGEPGWEVLDGIGTLTLTEPVPVTGR
jgi:serine/threonine-protein kinase RsbW